MKKSLLIISGVILLNIILVSCFCKETKVPYILLSGIFLSNYDETELLPDKSEINSDKFRLKLDIQGDFIAQRIVVPSIFHEAYATSCEPGDGVSGLKYDIKKLTLTCTEEIHNIEAGKNLAESDFIKIVYNWHPFVEISIPEWIKRINENESDTDDSYHPWSSPFRYPDQSYFFRFTKSFTTNDFVEFTLYIELDNDESFTAKTPQAKFI